MNRLQAGRTAENDKCARKYIWNGGVLVLRCVLHHKLIYFCVDAVHFFRTLYSGVILEMVDGFGC